MDVKGNILLPFAYDKVNEIIVKQIDYWRSYNPLDNMYIVTKNNRQGVINARGQAIVAIEYDTIEQISTEEYYHFVSNTDDKNITIVKDGVLLLLRRGNNRLLLVNFHSTKIDYAVVSKDNKQGVVSIPNGKIIVPIEYEEIEYSDDTPYAIATKQGQKGVLNLQDNTFAVVKGDKLDGSLLDRGYVIFSNRGKDGIADLTGKIIIPAEYNIFSNSELENINVKLIKNTYLIVGKNNKQGLLNLQTKKFIALNYDRILNSRYRLTLEPGYLVAIKDKKQGIIDLQGKVIVPLEDREIISYQNGVVLRGKGFDFDRQISLAENDRAESAIAKNRNSLINDLFVLTLEGKYSTFSCVIDRQGKLLVKSQHHNWGAREKIDNLCRSLVGIDVDNTAIRENPRSTELGNYDFFIRGDLILVKVNNKWGFANRKGDFVIEPQFDSAKVFSEGLAVVKQNGKYGYINTAGEMAIAPQFDYADYFSGSFAPVIENKKYNFIDVTGNTILNTENYPEVLLESGKE